MSDDKLVEDLLRPINKENSCGEWIRYEKKFLEISSEREEDDPELPMGEWERPLKKANWKTVIEKCSNLLINNSKDLQLVVWMSEAWINLNGMEGLLKSLKLFEGLVSLYWDELWPNFEFSEPEARVAPFIWINSKLLVLLRKKIILLPSNVTREEDILYKDWELLNTKNNEGQAVGFTKENIRKSLSSDDYNYLKKLIELSIDINRKIENIEKILDDKLKKDSPSLLKIKEYLTSIVVVSKSLLVEEKKTNSRNLDYKEHELAIDKKNDFIKNTKNKKNNKEIIFTNKTDIKNRNDAYETLDNIADYLEILEPHSPTPYLIRRAVKWGGMSLKELAEDIGKNDGSIQGLLSVVGLKNEKK